MRDTTDCWIVSFTGKTLTERVNWSRYEWAFVESPWKTMLHDLREQDLLEIDETLSGVLFGQRGELRWRKKRDGLFHAVLIEEGRDDDGAGVHRLRHLRKRRMLLWGEPDAETWWESRIPRAIVEYPKELRGKRVAMTGMEYEFEPVPGEPAVTLLRLVGFEEM